MVSRFEHSSASQSARSDQPEAGAHRPAVAPKVGRTGSLLGVGVAVVVLALLLWLLYGPGYLGIDGAWTVVWGRALVDGRALTPTLTTTPHVLSNVFGGLLAIFDHRDAGQLLIYAEYVAAAAFAAIAGLTARLVTSAAVSVGVVLLVASRHTLASSTAAGFLDVWAALLLAAALLCALRRGTERPGLTTVVLILAGLIRPEAWVLSGVHWVWCVWQRGSPSWWQLLGVFAAPVIWFAFDAFAFGDLLTSIHVTDQVNTLLREAQGRELSATSRVTVGPRVLAQAIGYSMAPFGLLAGMLAIVPARRLPRLLIPLAPPPDERRLLRIIAAGALVCAAAVCVQAVRGQLLGARFGLPLVAPVAVLAGWLAYSLARVGRERLRMPPQPTALMAIGLLIAAHLPSLMDARAYNRSNERLYAGIERAMKSSPRCLPVAVENDVMRGYASLWSDIGVHRIVDAGVRPAPLFGTRVIGVTERADQFLDAGYPRARLEPLDDPRHVADWLISSRCGR